LRVKVGFEGKGEGSALDEDRVAEAEARGRQVLAAEAAEELVIPPTTEDGAQLPRSIEALEDDPSVVGKAAHLVRAVWWYYRKGVWCYYRKGV
jgi:hypothetical protein